MSMNSPSTAASANENAIAFLRRLAQEGFWGTVTMKYQHGQVIHLTKEESIQPNQLEPENRRKHELTCKQ
jgi:hypothetical protein